MAAWCVLLQHWNSFWFKAPKHIADMDIRYFLPNTACGTYMLYVSVDLIWTLVAEQNWLHTC